LLDVVEVSVAIWTTVLAGGFLVEEAATLIGGCIRQSKVALQFEKRGIVIPRSVVRPVEIHRRKDVLTQRLCHFLRLTVDVALLGSAGEVAFVFGALLNPQRAAGFMV